MLDPIKIAQAAQEASGGILNHVTAYTSCQVFDGHESYSLTFAAHTTDGHYQDTDAACDAFPTVDDWLSAASQALNSKGVKGTSPKLPFEVVYDILQAIESLRGLHVITQADLEAEYRSGVKVGHGEYHDFQRKFKEANGLTFAQARDAGREQMRQDMRYWLNHWNTK